MLQSAVIEEKKFKYSSIGLPIRVNKMLTLMGRQPIRVNILMSAGRSHHYDHLLQV